MPADNLVRLADRQKAPASVTRPAPPTVIVNLVAAGGVLTLSVDTPDAVAEVQFDPDQADAFAETIRRAAAALRAQARDKSGQLTTNPEKQ